MRPIAGSRRGFGLIAGALTAAAMAAAAMAAGAMTAGALSTGALTTAVDDPVVPYWINPAAAAASVPAPAAPVAAASGQTAADEYTRYEVLEPDSSRFRIAFEVTATRAGATAYFNPIRKGSE